MNVTLECFTKFWCLLMLASSLMELDAPTAPVSASPGNLLLASTSWPSGPVNSKPPWPKVCDVSSHQTGTVMRPFWNKSMRAVFTRSAYVRATREALDPTDSSFSSSFALEEAGSVASPAVSSGDNA